MKARSGGAIVASGPAMTLDTVFRIASMTKAITSVAAMQLVEEGRLSARRAGAGYRRAGARTRRRCSKASTRPASRCCARRRRPITLQHLLTHTAGFTYEVWNADTLRYVEATGTPRCQLGQAGGAAPAARLRSRRALGIRHQHRLGRAASSRPSAGRTLDAVSARAHLRAARHGRHRLRADPGAAGAAGAACISGSPTAASSPQPLPPPSMPEFFGRRRRAALDRARLSDAFSKCCCTAAVSTAPASCGRKPSR